MTSKNIATISKKVLNQILKHVLFNVPGDGAVMECLRGQEHNLSGSCHRVLFKEMELQAQIPAVDYFLMRVCKNEIKHICGGKGNIQVIFFATLIKDEFTARFRILNYILVGC